MTQFNEQNSYQIPALYKVLPQDDGTLKALFMDGTLKLYDFKPLTNGEPLCKGEPVPSGNVPIFNAFNSTPELFGKCYVDLWRDQIIWNDLIDLPASIVWGDGTTIDSSHWTADDERKANPTRVRCSIPTNTNGVGYLEAWMLPRDGEKPSIYVEHGRGTVRFTIADGSIVDGEIPDDILAEVRDYLGDLKKRDVLYNLWDQCTLQKPNFSEGTR